MKSIIALFLSSVLFINTIMAKPVVSTETNLEVSMVLPLDVDEDIHSATHSAFSWEPEPYELKIGETYSFNTYILQPTVPSPISGILFNENDVSTIKRLLIGFEERITEVKQSERRICKIELDKRDELCKQLNLQLQTDLLSQQELNKTQIKLISSLESEMMWWKIGIGVTASILAGAVIYYEVR